MAPKLSKRTDFTIKDAKRCFEGLSDGAVAKWRPKGLINSTIVKRGTASEHHFDIFGILHLGVLLQLSVVGMLKYWQDFEIYIVKSDEVVKLIWPDLICTAYAKLREHALLTIWIYEHPLSGVYYRNRRAEVTHTAVLQKADDVFSKVEFFEPGKQPVKSYTSININIGMMLTHCVETLGAD